MRSECVGKSGFDHFGCGDHLDGADRFVPHRQADSPAVDLGSARIVRFGRGRFVGDIYRYFVGARVVFAGRQRPVGHPGRDWYAINEIDHGIAVDKVEK